MAASRDDHLPPSIYADDVIWPSLYAPPKSDQDVEIAIIGGGFTGITTALNLAEQGHQVHLYEAQRIGYGASGRNGGQLCQGWTTDFSKIMARIPHDQRRMAWDVGNAGRQIILDNCQKYGIDADLRFGYLHAALHQRHMAELVDMKTEWEEEGYDGFELLPDRESLEPHITSDAYIGGLYDAQSGHLHPLKYLLGLAKAAVAAGVTIHEMTPIRSIDTAKDHPQLHHDHGVVRAEKLILAGNAYLDKTSPKQMRQRLAPVMSGIIATEPLGDNIIKTLLPGRIAVADCNTALDYYRIDANGRMLFGGRASYMPMDNADITGYIRKKMKAVFPSLMDHRIEKAWSGRIGITIDRIPHFGMIGQNTFFVQGFSGHGVALTAVAAEILAEAIGGDRRRFDTFAAIRHLPFPGGIFRTPVLALGMSYYKMRDKLRI
jgi:gamma-glutamylputrescine oxidase